MFAQVKSWISLRLMGKITGRQQDSVNRAMEELEQLRPYYEPAFGGLINATWLRLYNRGLTALPECIGLLSDLRRLGIHDNALSEIPDSISVLTRLTELIISNNQLFGQIQHLTNIEILSMYGNQISELPEWITSMRRLARIDIAIDGETLVKYAPTGITSLPCWDQKKDMSIMRKLELYDHIQLETQDLTVVDDFISEWGNAGKIDLSNNQIMTLPAQVSLLTQIRSIYLGSEKGGNKFTECPLVLSCLTRLQDLSICFNKISDLPHQYSKLTNLSRLDMSSNKFSWIPDSVFKFTNLQELRIQDNPILDIPEWISSLKKLWRFQIQSPQGIDVLRRPRDLSALPCWRNNMFRITKSYLTCSGALRKLDLNNFSTTHAVSTKSFAIKSALLADRFPKIKEGVVMRLITPTNINGWYRADVLGSVGWVSGTNIEILPPGDYDSIIEEQKAQLLQQSVRDQEMLMSKMKMVSSWCDDSRQQMLTPKEILESMKLGNTENAEEIPQRYGVGSQ